MNQYEIVIIFTPVLSNEDLKKVIDKYKEFLTTNGAEIVGEEDWGLRQLAYPIKKKTTGIYQIFEIKAPTDLNHKLEIQFRRDDNVIRFLTTRLDKYGIEYNDKRRKGELGPNRKKKAQEESVTEETQETQS